MEIKNSVYDYVKLCVEDENMTIVKFIHKFIKEANEQDWKYMYNLAKENGCHIEDMVGYLYTNFQTLSRKDDKFIAITEFGGLYVYLNKNKEVGSSLFKAKARDNAFIFTDENDQVWGDWLIPLSELGE